MMNNLDSIEFCFENGDGVTVDVNRFFQFSINNNEISFMIAKENNFAYYDEWTGNNILFDRLLKNDVTQIFIHDKDKAQARYLAEFEDMYGEIMDYMNTYIDNGDLVCSIKVVA